jgi:hypothetical protein
MASDDPLYGDLARAKEGGTSTDFNWFAPHPDQPDGYYIGDIGFGIQDLSASDLSGQMESFSSLSQAESYLNNPAFSTFYNNFLPEEYKFDRIGGDNPPGVAANWFRKYGGYLSPYDESKESMISRSSGLKDEELRLSALKSIDDIGGFVGKRNFAGDSEYVKAMTNLRETAILNRDLKTLGVNQSLWDIKDNYLSNLYSEFGNLAHYGAYEEDQWLDDDT